MNLLPILKDVWFSVVYDGPITDRSGAGFRNSAHRMDMVIRPGPQSTRRSKFIAHGFNRVLEKPLLEAGSGASSSNGSFKKIIFGTVNTPLEPSFYNKDGGRRANPTNAGIFFSYHKEGHLLPTERDRQEIGQGNQDMKHL